MILISETVNFRLYFKVIIRQEVMDRHTSFCLMKTLKHNQNFTISGRISVWRYSTEFSSFIFLKLLAGRGSICRKFQSNSISINSSQYFKHASFKCLLHNMLKYRYGKTMTKDGPNLPNSPFRVWQVRKRRT
jgi:hypothetical protein